jgi:hypothetical protein
MRALVIALVLSAGIAHADDDPRAASPDVATGLSMGVTAAGAGLVAAGSFDPRSDAGRLAVLGGSTLLFVGPLVGHWYAGEIRVTPGLAMRSGAIGLAFVGILAYGLECLEVDTDDGQTCGARDAPVAVGVAAIGAALFIGGAIYDIASAGDTARRANDRRAAARRAGWAVAPLYSPTTRGVSLAARF